MSTTVPSPAYTTTGIIKSITHTVESATEPGKSYTVGVNPISMRPQSCTCTAASYGRQCWHKQAVRDGRCTCKPRATYGPKVDPRITEALSLYA